MPVRHKDIRQIRFSRRNWFLSEAGSALIFGVLFYQGKSTVKINSELRATSYEQKIAASLKLQAVANPLNPPF